MLSPEDVANEEMLYDACNKGIIPSVHKAIDLGAKNLSYGLFLACKKGNIKLVNILIDRGANDWNNGYAGACTGGHRILMNMMKKAGANDMDRGFIMACEYGSLNTIKYLATEYNVPLSSGLISACHRNNPAAISLLIQMGATGIHFALIRSAIEGHLHNVSTLMMLGNPTIDDMNRTLYFACKFGRQDIVDYLIEIGATSCSCKKTIADHTNDSYDYIDNHCDHIDDRSNYMITDHIDITSHIDIINDSYQAGIA